MRKLLVAVALLMMIPGAASAGGGGDISLCSGFATGTTVSMLDSCFNGTAHFAPTDTTLLISNDGGMSHTFTAVDGAFDSGQIEPGETFELTIDEPGVFEVFCTLHGTADGEGMAGVLLVGEAAPGPVSSGMGLTEIRQALAEDGVAVTEALDRQTQAIGNLTASQATLRHSLEEHAPAAEAAAPTVVAVPVASEAEGLWLPLVSGLAVGLALAALISTRRSRRRENVGIGGTEGLQPSLES
jgi:hypothetical protein